MKLIFLLVGLLGLQTFAQLPRQPGFLSENARQDCKLVNKVGPQKHFVCQTTASTRPYHLLDLTGDFKTISYYHGRFLAREIADNLLKGLRETEQQALADLPAADRQQVLGLRSCMMMRYKSGSSHEFNKGAKAMYTGMRDAGVSIEKDQAIEAHYLVEFSIFSDALIRAMEENSSSLKRDLMINCGPHLIGKKIGKSMVSFGRFLRKMKMGCSGIIASGSGTQNHQLIHARNFDTGQLGVVETVPVVQIQRLSATNYNVGMTTAGVPYSGGVTGFNSSGISISMHELQTRNVRLFAEPGTTDISPFLAHKILMKAKTIDEAIAMIKEHLGFGAWIFMIGDSKTQEAASIELAGDRVEVARRNRNSYMGQANHFLGKSTRKVGFEYSANKTLESISRLEFLNRELAADFGKIDAPWMMDHLTGHWDEFMGVRSFGRTTTKVYTAMSHVMIPSRREWWLTLTDRYPTNRSAYVGMRLDLNSETPVTLIGSYEAKEELAPAAWYDSLQHFVGAWKIINSAGKLNREAYLRANAELELAQNKAYSVGITEFPYHFMWARNQIHAGALALASNVASEAEDNLNAAETKLEFLFENVKLHDFEKGQIIYWLKRISDLRHTAQLSNPMSGELLVQGQALFNKLYQKYPQQNLYQIMGESLKQRMTLEDIIADSPELVTVE